MRGVVHGVALDDFENDAVGGDADLFDGRGGGAQAERRVVDGGRVEVDKDGRLDAVAARVADGGQAGGAVDLEEQLGAPGGFKNEPGRHAVALGVAAPQQTLVGEHLGRGRRQDDGLELGVETVLLEHLGKPARAGLGDKRPERLDCGHLVEGERFALAEQEHLARLPLGGAESRLEQPRHALKGARRQADGDAARKRPQRVAFA